MTTTTTTEKKKKKKWIEELLNEIGDITEEELKAAFSRAEMQLNDASSALLALLTQVPVRLPDTYTIHDNINSITDSLRKMRQRLNLSRSSRESTNEVRETSRRGRVCAGNNRKRKLSTWFRGTRASKKRGIDENYYYTLINVVHYIYLQTLP